MSEYPVRLNKYLAACGVSSRREADRLAQSGRVSVDGSIAGPGSMVGEHSVVELDGKVLTPCTTARLFAWYKPRGVVSTMRDPHAERTVATELEGRLPKEGRFVYIGRLDKESEGLLLLTNDSSLAHDTEKGGGSAEKEYLADVDREIGDDDLKKLSGGVFIDELGITTRPCVIERVSDKRYRIVLTEGKNRQIRRMFGTLGVSVTRLIRVREGGVELGDMKPGEIREVDPKEL